MCIRDRASTWQAEWRNNATGAQMEAIVDWGDALLSKTYTSSSIVRIETTLKQDATIAGVTDTMTAYRMALLSGSQTTELQGTDGTTIASPTRNVFAINARLKIEKIATGGGADTVVFDKAVYEGFGVSEEGGGGSTVVSGSFRTEVAADAVALMGPLLDVRDRPLTEAEIDNARRYITGVQPLQYATASGVCNGVLTLLSAGLPATYVDELRAAFGRVTPETASEAVERLLPPDDLTLLVVGDAAALAPGLRDAGYAVEVIPADGAV